MLTLMKFDPLPILCPAGHSTFATSNQEIRKRTDVIVYGCCDCFPDGYRQYRIAFSAVSKLFKEPIVDAD